VALQILPDCHLRRRSDGTGDKSRSGPPDVVLLRGSGLLLLGGAVRACHAGPAPGARAGGADFGQVLPRLLRFAEDPRKLIEE